VGGLLNLKGVQKIINWTDGWANVGTRTLFNTNGNDGIFLLFHQRGTFVFATVRDGKLSVQSLGVTQDYQKIALSDNYITIENLGYALGYFVAYFIPN
jgi:hypothetical protein